MFLGGDRISDFQIGCSETNDMTLPTCYQHVGALAEGETINFTLNVNHTRFVVVRLLKRKQLHLCELEVYGKPGKYLWLW